MTTYSHTYTPYTHLTHTTYSQLTHSHTPYPLTHALLTFVTTYSHNLLRHTHNLLTPLAHTRLLRKSFVTTYSPTNKHTYSHHFLLQLFRTEVVKSLSAVVVWSRTFFMRPGIFFMGSSTFSMRSRYFSWVEHIFHGVEHIFSWGRT